jgi:hypothetical protein
MARLQGTLERFHWLATVKDPAGRDRDVLLGVRAGTVVTLVPPGEGFTQTPEGARELAAHYAAAAHVAERDNSAVMSRQRAGAASDHPEASRALARTSPPPHRSQGRNSSTGAAEEGVQS